MFQKIRLQFLNNEACPVSAGANMDIIQAGGTDIKISIRESSQPCMAQSVSQNHECLSVASSHGVADTLQCVDVWLGNSSSSLDCFISEYHQQNGLWLQQAICPAGGGGECGHHR